jgi:hypothetical protein
MRADKLTGELLCGYGTNSRPVAFGSIHVRFGGPMAGGL